MITDKSITEYSIRYTTPEDDVLSRLYRETHLTTVYPNMLSGPLQGRLLEFISRMIKPDRILEIGTFTGYSAIFMARGLAPGGMLHTIDINDELSETALHYFREAGIQNSVKLHVGNALDIIPRLNEIFDLVYIDADKEEYISYYELVLPKVKDGGFILADNVLWGGKVLPGSADHERETVSIRKFNDHILNDRRVEKLMLPFRDGIYMLYKLAAV